MSHLVIIVLVYDPNHNCQENEPTAQSKPQVQVTIGETTVCYFVLFVCRDADLLLVSRLESIRSVPGRLPERLIF